MKQCITAKDGFNHEFNDKPGCTLYNRHRTDDKRRMQEWKTRSRS